MKISKDTRTRGVSVSTMETVVAVLFIVMGGVMMADNHRIGAGWAKDGPQAGYFPFRIGLIISVLGVVAFYQAWFGKTRSAGTFVVWQRFKPVLMVLAPTTLYVLCIELLGIYVASTLFIAFFMLTIGKFGWFKTALVSVAFTAACFWLFEMKFMIALPKGPLEALFGY